MSTPKPVHVAWIDSIYSSGWQEEKDCPDLPVIHSVGYPVREDKQSITLTTSIDPDNRNTMCPLTIPKCSIIHIKHCSIQRTPRK